jgi:TrpR-related protein YerC/YecD
MKQRRHTPEQDRQARQALCRAILCLGDMDEIRAFLEDLTTPAELQALADRWHVVELLKQDLPYREIAERTGVSVTTTGRVARCLSDSRGGYNIAWRKLDNKHGMGKANG